MFALNFYSPIVAEQLRSGRKTATIRLGDKSRKYTRGQVVWITVGYRHQPREKIFSAVIDEVEVKQVKDLSPRDVEHDNPARRLYDRLGFRHVDTNGVYGAPRFYSAAKKAGVRALVGSELVLEKCHRLMGRFQGKRLVFWFSKIGKGLFLRIGIIKKSQFHFKG